MNGLLSGMATGAITGSVAGLKYAHDNKINSWTGKGLNLNSDKISLGTRNSLNSESNSYNGRTVTNPVGDQVTLDIPSNYIIDLSPFSRRTHVLFLPCGRIERGSVLGTAPRRLYP